MNDIRDYRPTVLGGPIGGESPRVSSLNPLAGSREPATEHIRNAQQIALDLSDLLKRKDLVALATDVESINDRLRLALQEIEEGNIGR